MQIQAALFVLNDILTELADLSRTFQKSDITPMEAQAVAYSKIAKLQAQYLGEHKHWSATVQDLINKSTLTMEEMAPVVTFIERLCTHLKDRFPDDNKLSYWCIFDYSCIKQADFDFGSYELEELLKQFSCFFHCHGPGHESNARNAYNDFKFLAKEMFKASGSVSLSDLAGICFRHEKFSTILCLLQICSSFQASSADCERGFSLMNRIKTKNRCRLDSYHLDQLMMVKSVFTTASETTDDEGDKESATYQDSAINLDKVYKH